MWLRTRVVVACAVGGSLLFAAVGCSSRDDAHPGPGAASGSSGTATDPVVAGGVSAVAPPGAAPVCAALAASRSVRGIPGAVAAMADPQTSAGGAGVLHAAATDLRMIADGDGKPFTADLHQAASRLDHLADVGPSDQDAVAATSSELSKLGKEVQGQCKFALGGSQ